eukprot:1159986-Pelagomonas_calceolata.AAC.5
MESLRKSCIRGKDTPYMYNGRRHVGSKSRESFLQKALSTILKQALRMLFIPCRSKLMRLI